MRELKDSVKNSAPERNEEASSTLIDKQENKGKRKTIK